MATLQASKKEQIDTCNEIHRKLVFLNLQTMLIDQQLQKLLQEGSELRDQNIDVSFLTTDAAAVKEDQESAKRRLRELLVRMFQPNCLDIGNLEGFVLEQEVYRLMMSSKTGDIAELKLFMAKIEDFTRSVGERNVKVKGLKMKIDEIRKKKNLGTWNNHGKSGDEAQSDQLEFNHDSMFDDFDSSGKWFDPFRYFDNHFSVKK